MYHDSKSWVVMKFMRYSLLLLLLAAGNTYADSTSHLRVSLLTVGTGDEIYAAFGHTGIRILDSSTSSDIVYNWGTFDGYQKDFELKFMRGKLLYYASSETFQNFYSTYVREQRGVEEQLLLLNDAQKERLLSFMLQNQTEENRYYKYDFLYDNCATRLRDIFPKAFGSTFRWGSAIPAGQRITFRDKIDHYLERLPWERFGIDLLLGSPIDKVMRNEDAMFLPDYLRDGLRGAQIGGIQIAAPARRLLPPAPTPAKPVDGPFILCMIWAALIIIGTAIPGIKPIGVIAGQALLIVTGLLGCLMVFMWIGTDHQACRNNFNVLWCLPTNIIIPFVKRERRSRYALVALVLLAVALLLHLLHIQALPLGQCWPLIAALGAAFGMIYRAATAPPTDESEEHHHHH